MAGSPLPISAQPASPPTFGLLASITPEPNAPPPGIDRWRSGITYRPEGCIEGSPQDPCDAGSSNKDIPTSPDTVTWLPFGLSIMETCSTFSGTEENAGRVRRALNADTERQMAREFWTGELVSGLTDPNTGGAYPNTWLADPSDTDILAATTDPLVGLQCLDAYLGRHNGGQPGIIHATIETLDIWKRAFAIDEEDENWYTPNDNLVITSPGYTGDGPNDPVATGAVWAFATDMVRIFLSPIQEFPLMHSIDRVNNSVNMLAERFAIVEFPRCRHAGIELNVPLCTDTPPLS